MLRSKKSMITIPLLICQRFWHEKLEFLFCTTFALIVTSVEHNSSNHFVIFWGLFTLETNWNSWRIEQVKCHCCMSVRPLNSGRIPLQFVSVSGVSRSLSQNALSVFLGRNLQNAWPKPGSKWNRSFNKNNHGRNFPFSKWNSPISQKKTLCEKLLCQAWVATKRDELYSLRKKTSVTPFFYESLPNVA